MPPKHLIHAAFLEALNIQIEMLTATIADLKYSAGNETKSTAGDKHETALAHLQIQQNQINTQLQKLEENKAILQKIDFNLTHTSIRLGSVIATNKGNLYMCVALPAIFVEATKIIAISPMSPLGSKLIGKQINETVEFNQVQYLIMLIH